MTREDDSRRAWSTIVQLHLSNEQHERVLEVTAEVGLRHPGALKLLLQLGDSEPPTMGDIARSMDCDASYVTSLVDALEEPGLAERRVSSLDRRVKIIHLTATGAEACRRARQLLAEPPRRMERLDAAETRLLARLLEKLVGDT